MVTKWLQSDRSQEQPGTAAGGQRFLSVLNREPGNRLKMRLLAARLRGHAAETSLDLYRRKFEGIAAELEEAALDAESRETRFKLVS